MDQLVLLVYLYAIGHTVITAVITVVIYFAVPSPHKVWAIMLTLVVWFFTKGPMLLAFLFGFVPSS